MEELGRTTQREYYRNYREKNQERIKQYQAKYRETHKEEIKQRNRLYWENRARKAQEVESLTDNA